MVSFLIGLKKQFIIIFKLDYVLCTRTKAKAPYSGALVFRSKNTDYNETPQPKETMFKKRSVLLKVVPDPTPTSEVADSRFQVDFNKIYDRTVDGATKLLGTYILADTARKIAIHIVETKVR